MSQTSLLPPKVTKFSELAVGETGDVYVLVADVTTNVAASGNPYVKLTVRDRRRSAAAFVWSDKECYDYVSRRVKAGEVYKIRGRFVQDEKFGAKLEIDKIRVADPVTDGKDYAAEDLFDSTRFEVPAMWLELHSLVAEHVRDAGLRVLTADLLRRNEAAFKIAPASAMNHHAYVGGLLEHTLSVVRLSLHLADKYAEYYRGVGVAPDKDLMIAGAVLHDIGKVVELDIRPGVGDFTTAGRLVGHILQGRDMLREAAAAVPNLDPRKLMLLEHIIIGHQGKREWSSPIEPKTIECLLVHYADDLDAKAAMFVKAVVTDAGDGEFTGRKNPFNRELYKPT